MTQTKTEQGNYESEGQGKRALSEEQIEQILQTIASDFGVSMRSPILHTPAEYDLDFEEVTFPSLDGVPLEGWFIPAPSSNKLIIANHPLWFSRSGLPSHLEPWKTIGAAGGNDFEVNLVPDYKILHDAGYNVLTYDFRNFGHSGAANGGIISAGIFEARDVIGSLNYVRSREDLRDMIIGLFSRCMGCNATMFAMAKYPEAFREVRCMVAPQPLSVRVTLEQSLAHIGIADRIDDLEERIRLHNSFRLDDMSPVQAAKSVKIPTFLYQVHDDVMTRPSDIQAMYDNIPIEEKKLFWIKGTSRRWDGYTYFAKDSSQMLDWFNTYMN
ncbi:alpha/beta hydrolase [Paenibacillus sp. 1P07SE]|uniref:alpha/beta hydrolase n=1 Tax=Paenibacillus sp. 1P07SE TaxID=3132209 RepID=UPI0039A66CD9